MVATAESEVKRAKFTADLSQKLRELLPVHDLLPLLDGKFGAFVQRLG
jgi:hypothetical protein